ncbi:UbiA family prenyltransferase [Nocardioides sp. CFH 31398]|uniref:UbiA family prenyltransferase n=1 Tax=Nocardioides sp. CFH 31398 TaxID=2919579 RepID=UPI001F061510|nr:UbiA family prenyltransferase [Nocardioides sp. CFH 31398]MCH1868030.1 UbiA family prenyltransferase [Nocardioides sp. CFH 31398]
MTALLRACHPAPTLAVTLLSGVLAVGAGLGGLRVLLVVVTVLAGQLAIGWANDAIDAARDRQVGRTDKPLVSGAVSLGTVRAAAGLALVVAVGLSLAVGVAVAGVAGVGAAVAANLVLVGGLAYDLGAKATVWSWAPYALAFGALPAFVLLTGELAVPVWVVAAGALLGVGAHVLNVVPDVADDAATGVRGLPHRLAEAHGVRAVAPAGALLLVLATVVLALGAPVTGALLVGLVVVVGALAATAVVAGGRTAFRAAMAIALVDVVLLVVAQGRVGA